MKAAQDARVPRSGSAARGGAERQLAAAAHAAGAEVARLDAHQHFWRLARGDYRWLAPSLAPLYRDFEPAELAPQLAAAGLNASIAVQAADSAAETRFLLELAHATPFVAGVVGWVDLAAPDAVRAIESLAEDALVLGLRPMLQDLPDERWLLRAELAPALDALESAQLSFDALVRPQHLPVLRAFVEARPGLRVVIDHAAKPRVGGPWEGRARWRSELRALAAHPQVCCKLSGLATEAAPGAARADYAEVVDHVLECFGPARTLWGSDWPVLELASDYASWWQLCGELLAGLSAHERQQVQGGSAAEFYRLAPKGRGRA